MRIEYKTRPWKMPTSKVMAEREVEKAEESLKWCFYWEDKLDENSIDSKVSKMEVHYWATSLLGKENASELIMVVEGVAERWGIEKTLWYCGNTGNALFSF